jgi:predicted ATPase
MFIERLAVKGFRSLADVVWEPGKLNVLIGPNGGGKTNLLKVVRLLKASAAGQLGKFVQREGGMQVMVWDGSARQIQIECRNRFIEECGTYSLVLLKDPASPASYYIEREQLVASERLSADTQLLMRNLSGAFVQTDSGERADIKIQAREGETTLWALQGPIGPSALANWFSMNLLLASIHGIVDLRPSREPRVVAFEETIDDNGENFIPALHHAYNSSRDFKRDINLGMSAAFGSEFVEIVFPAAADQRIQLRVRWKSLEHDPSAASLSDGTLRFMFLVTVLANPKRPEFIAIEEPETGLHPSMLPIVADFAAEAAERSQIVFTTHSPAFLDAIGKHNPTITVVEARDGKTQLRNVSGNELEYWLKRFTLGDIYQSGELERIG